MLPTNYLNFDLSFQRSDEGYRTIINDAPAGEASAPFHQPFSPTELNDFYNIASSSRPETQKFIEEIGERLFNAVFVNGVFTCLRESFSIARSDQQGLRIRLRLSDTPELAELPWECLYDSEVRQFLTLSSEIALVYYLEVARPIRTLTVQPPLRILAVFSSPTDLPRLDIEEEWKAIREALNSQIEQGLIVLERGEGATTQAIRGALRQSDYHILHFTGHADFDQRTGEGIIILEDGQGRGQPIRGRELGTLLAAHTPMRLILLNSGDTARSSSADLYSGIAQRLVQQGIPSVIALRYPIQDQAAIIFAQQFYGALADGYPIDTALTKVRVAMSSPENSFEWAIPALFMRSPDGHLFYTKTEPIQEPKTKPYLNFDLSFQRTSIGYRVRVINSPAGEANVEFMLPFSSGEVDNIFQQLQWRGLDPSTMREFGSRLFESVFVGNLRDCYRHSLAIANNQGNGIRLRLRFPDATELAQLPWEFLYDSGNADFIALSRDTPVVRYLDLRQPARLLRVSPPLRILVIIAAPTDLPPLDVEREWANITTPLSHLSQQGAIILERLRVGTLANLQQTLRTQEYHVLHFLGHGFYDERSQQGNLVFENESGSSETVHDAAFAALLNQHPSLRLIVLNSCDGARTSRLDTFTGVAQHLIQQRIPAVIAMQTVITDEMSIIFSKELYEALARSLPLDIALTEARLAMYIQNDASPEWAAPVLYMRSPDGRLFDFAAPAKNNVAIKVCLDKFLPDRVRQPGLAYLHSDVDDRPEEIGRTVHIGNSKLWPTGSTLRVRFLDGDLPLHDRVAAVAHVWSQYANIKFEFGHTPDAEIRISFKQVGSWSYIGTDALAIPKNEPTMNFGWLTAASPEDELRSVVLHEFGHALGMVHEHHTPPAGIHWNREAVFRYFAGTPIHWSYEQVDRLFARYNAPSTNFSQFDSSSIMLFAIPSEFTIDGFIIGWNTTLSELDKAYIGQIYPIEDRLQQDRQPMPSTQSSQTERFTINAELLSRLSSSSLRALRWAEGLRQALKAPHIDPIHLLAGLYQSEHGTTRQLLHLFDEPEVIEQKLSAAIGAAIDFTKVQSVSPDGLPSVPLSPATYRVLVRADKWARETDVPNVRMRYLLAHLIVMNEDEVGAWLADLLQIDYATLCNLTMAMLPKAPDFEKLRQASARSRPALIAYALELRAVPALVPVQGEFAVEVELRPLAAGDSAATVIETPAHETELNLLLKPPAGVEVLQGNALTLVLEGATFDPAATSLSIQRGRFHLRATHPAANLAIGVEILTDSGLHLKRSVTITVPEPDTEAVLTPRLPLRPPRAVPHPDLIVQIQTRWNQGRSAFELHYTVMDGSTQAAGDAILPSPPLAAGWIEQTHRLLGVILAGTAGGAASDRAARLAAFGQYLLQQLGAASCQQLWRRLVPDRGRRSVLLLVADDAWLPWELLHNGRAFLGERVTIGRWPLEQERLCPAEFPVGQIHLAYYESVEEPTRWPSLLQPLNAPAAELLPGGTLESIEVVHALHGLHLLKGGVQPGAQLVNLPVLRQMTGAETAADEGVAGATSEDGGLELRQAQLNLRRNRPLVSVGYLARGQADLAELPNRWATQLLTAGSSALVGPLWAVDPAVEAAFVRSFYDALWLGYALGEAFASARQRIQALTGNGVDGLAYLLFGDPMARPYLPVRSEGYAVIEPVGRDLEAPVRPHEQLRFRLSLRRRPPVWHNERVVEISEELTFDQLQVRVITDGLAVAPASTIPMQKIGDDYWGWVTLTAPADFDEESSLVQFYFVDGKRLIYTTAFDLTIENN